MLNSASSSGSEKELTEVKLPGVKLLHLKKAIKFLYTGKLNISMKEIKNDHLVWHINNILVDLFKIDAKLNLPIEYLIPPPEEDDRDNDDSPGDGANGLDDIQNKKQNLSNNRVRSDAFQSNSHHVSDIENTRQSTQMKEIQIDHDESKENQIKVENITREPEELDRNVATPDIIDLLDSDDDCDNNNYFECGNLDEVSSDQAKEEEKQTVDLNKNHEKQCNDTATDQSFKGIKRGCPEEDIDSYDYSHDPVTAPSLTPARRKSRGGSHPSHYSDVNDVPISSVLTEPSRRESQGFCSTSRVNDSVRSPPSKKRAPEDPLESPVMTNDLLQSAMDAIYIPAPTPSQSSDDNSANVVTAPVVARKSVPALIPVQNNVSAAVLPHSSTVHKGVRTHHHSPWTISGLRKPETILDLNQPKTYIHECEVCGAKFDHLKSLTIHIGRSHNHKSMVPCPEGCGKMLTTQAAIKKHLLSHRPEEEWPYKCPLCPKKFQARGDIPKHLMTKIHEADNVPEKGTRAWFDLIYHDDPTYVYENKMRELHKKKAQGKMC